MWGFDNPKDVIEVLIVPVALFAFGAWLPSRLEHQTQITFLKLIRRELEEMTPKIGDEQSSKPWPLYLAKRFIHEDIFKQPSLNRDFILSLDPAFAYDMAQLWFNFEKAHKVAKKYSGNNSQVSEKDKAALKEYGDIWLPLLKKVCKYLDKQQENNRWLSSVFLNRRFEKKFEKKYVKLFPTVYTKWEEVYTKWKRLNEQRPAQHR